VLFRSGAKARFDGGNVSAEVEADFTGNVPSYHAVGDATDLTWKAGKINADMSVDTSGLGMDALANFRAEGSFNARDVDPEYVSIGGCFQFALGGKSPRVKLSSLQVSDGEEIFVGAGSTTAGGELVLDLAGVTKPVRLTLR